MAARSSISKTMLPNGVRIISEEVPYVDSVSVGVWELAGSRDEGAKVSGISHFVEHMLFKGTERRTAHQIADEMDGIGGHINAFTDKEFTCYYAKVLREHLDTAVDVLSDMFLNSVLDSSEIEREKNVVLEEIKRHDDTPEDQVHDLLAETLWKGHRLANPVIGSAAAVKRLSRDDLVEYIGAYYRPNAILVAAAGNVEHSKLVDLVAGAFGAMTKDRELRKPVEARSVANIKVLTKPTEQVHLCLGTRGYRQQSEEKYALAVIDAALGGGMSSRLFQEVREKRGLAYAIGSYSASYQEAGLFAIYGGTSMSNLQSVLEVIRKECESIRKDSVTDAELERAKNQIRGALVLGQESMSNRMSRLAKSEIYFGRIIRPEEIISAILSVSKDDVADVAAQVFDGHKFAVAAIGPFDGSDSVVKEALGVKD
jgi:predicted Zn-dependent peptidase